MWVGTFLALNPKGNQKYVPGWAAFGVHVLTASGALWALLGLMAGARGDWALLFAWLGVALIVDGIDGPLARSVNITDRLPKWSGSSLDYIVDYATYVFLPAFAVAQASLLSSPLNLIGAGLIVVCGALYFAAVDMKTSDNCFKGFPAVWNMVVFDLFVFDLSEITIFLIIILFCVLTFLPIKFIHPVRVTRLRPLSLLMTFLWLGSAVMAGRNGMSAEGPAAFILAASSAYLLAIGAVLQLYDARKRLF